MRQHGNKSFVLHIIPIQKMSLAEGFYVKSANSDVDKTMFCAETRHKQTGGEKMIKSDF